MTTEASEVYECEICGAIVEVKEGGAGELECCGQPMTLKVWYTKTDLVFGFPSNQILVAVILAQLYLGFYPKTIMRRVYFKSLSHMMAFFVFPLLYIVLFDTQHTEYSIFE